MYAARICMRRAHTPSLTCCFSSPEIRTMNVKKEFSRVNFNYHPDVRYLMLFCFLCSSSDANLPSLSDPATPLATLYFLTILSSHR